MSRHTRLINLVCLIGQPLLLNALSVPATAYIVRQLGPYAYGQWMVAVSLSGFAAFLGNLGLRTVFIRFVAQNPDVADDALAEQLGLRLLLALAAGSLVVALAFCLAYPPVVCQCAILAAAGLVFTTLAGTLSDVLQGFQQFRLFAGVNLVSGLLLTLLSVVAVNRGQGAVGLSAAYLSGPIVSFCLLLYLVHNKLFPVHIHWNLSRYLELLREVRLLGGQQFLTAIQERIEQLLIPKLVGLSAFGYFSAGAMPANRLIVFPDGLATAHYPKIAQNYQEDFQSASRETARLLTLSLIVCLPLALLLTYFAHPIAYILFPKNPQVCWCIIKITIWSVPLLGISMPITYALQAVGQHKETARANIVAIGVIIVLSVFLVSRVGILGACLCSVVRPLIAIACLFPRFVRTFPLIAIQLPITRLLCCTLFMGGLLWLGSQQYVSGLWFVVFSILSLALYVVALVALRVVLLPEYSRG